ncbi:MAG: hypothetical protein ABIN48_03075 [Ginsengibacter sp.]
MYKTNPSIKYILSFYILFLFSCDSGQKEIVQTRQDTIIARTDTSVTNPLFQIAPIEYADSSEKAFRLMADFNFDAWGEMLADTVVYSFPDGDAHSRTSLRGKDNVINWWKYWLIRSRVNSMSMASFNHVPINVISEPEDGFPMGIYDLVYFTNTIVFNEKSVGIRMNFSVHFNADKKIDHYASYYDNNVLIREGIRMLK